MQHLSAWVFLALTTGLGALPALLMGCLSSPQTEDRSVGSCFESLTASHTEHDSLVLHACALSQQYRTQGPVFVAVMAYNLNDGWSAEGALFEPAFSFGGSLRATVIGPSGDTLPTLAHVDYETHDAVVGLHGHHFLGTIVDIRCPFQLPGGKCVTFYAFDEPGEYLVTFTLDRSYRVVDCGEECAGKQLVAEPVVVRIVE